MMKCSELALERVKQLTKTMTKAVNEISVHDKENANERHAGLEIPQQWEFYLRAIRI